MGTLPSKSSSLKYSADEEKTQEAARNSHIEVKWYHKDKCMHLSILWGSKLFSFKFCAKQRLRTRFALFIT